MESSGCHRPVRTDSGTSTQSSHQANTWTIATQTHREWIDTNGVKKHDDDDDFFFVERIAEASWMFEPLIIESGDRIKSTCTLK